MDSDKPNRPEGSSDQQSGQPYGSASQGDQPSGAYSPPSESGSYSQPQSQSQQPSQPYGAPPPQGGYGQPQYSDRPGSQPAQQPQYGDQPQYQQPTGGYSNQQQQYYGGMTPPPTQVNVPPKKSNNGLLFGIIGLVVLLIAGGAIAYFLLNKGGTTAVSAKEEAVAKSLPANALGYISLSTNVEGSQKAAFDKLREAFEAQPGFKETWGKLISQAPDPSSSNPGNEMVQQIQGLLTKYTKQLSFAVLPPSESDWARLRDAPRSEFGSCEECNAIMADMGMRSLVIITDMDLAQFKKDATQSEVSDTYNGVEISRIVTGTLPPIYAASLDGGAVATALKVDPLKTLIDRAKSNQSNVRDTELYKALSGMVPSERVASFYLNLTEINTQLKASAPEALTSSGVESIGGAILFTVSAQDDGLQLDMASQVDVKNNFTTQPVSTAKPDASTLNDIPSDSLAFYLGTDLKTLIKIGLDAIRTTSTRNGGQDPIAPAAAQLKQMTGLDLENDIIALLGGDFALSVSPGDPANPISSGLFQLKLNGGDRDKAADVVDKLIKAAFPRGATSFDAAGGKFYDLGTSIFGSSSNIGITAGVGKDRFMIFYTGDKNNMRSGLDDVSGKFGQGFGTTPKWATVKDHNHLPNDSNGILYVDLDAIRSMFEGGLPNDMKPFLKPFKYLVSGTAVQVPPGGSTPNRTHTRIFLGISK